jgi:hypothetical protein
MTVMRLVRIVFLCNSVLLLLRLARFEVPKSPSSRKTTPVKVTAFRMSS